MRKFSLNTIQKWYHYLQQKIDQKVPSPADSGLSSKPRALSKFFSMFLTLSWNLLTAPVRSGNPPRDILSLNQAISTNLKLVRRESHKSPPDQIHLKRLCLKLRNSETCINTNQIIVEREREIQSR